MSALVPTTLLASPPLSLSPLLARLLTITLWAVAILLLLFILVMGLRWIARTRKRLGKCVFHLHFTNQGNLNCHYALQAQEPARVLRFHFLLNGVELPEFVPPKPPPTTTVVPAAVVQQASPVSPARPTRKPPSGFKKKSAQARRSIGVVAGILSTLGALLPGSAGRSAAQAGSKVRFGQAQAGRAAQVSSGISNLSGKAPSEEGVPPQGGHPPQVGHPPPVGAKQSIPEPSSYNATLHPAPAEPDTQFPGQWVQTPFVAPGESILLDLHVIPNNPRRSQLYTFKIVARCVEALAAAGGKDLRSPVESVETGQTQIRGIPWIGVYWPQILWILFTTALGVVIFGFLVTSLSL